MKRNMFAGKLGFAGFRAFSFLLNAGVAAATGLLAVNAFGAVPALTSVSPGFGPAGTAVTITGANFDATATNNLVYFGAARAEVTAASASALTVTVPPGATFKPITVTVGGLTGASANPFVLTFAGAALMDGSAFTLGMTTNTGSSPNQFVIADLDNDGKPDLAATCGSGNLVSVYRNVSTNGSLGAGSFGARVDLAVGAGPSYLAVADIDGDGKLDLVVPNGTDNTVSVLRNLSTPGSLTATSFAAKVDFAAGSGPRSVAVADLDGDGKPEILVANYSANTLSVLRNTSTPGTISSNSLAAKVDFAAGSGPANFAVGDLNGDGKPEIVVANYTGANVSVLPNQCSVGAIDASSFGTKIDLATTTGPIGMGLADLNGDGLPELVVGAYSSQTVSVFSVTNGSGAISANSFAPRVDFGVGANVKTLALADLNGDGKVDVIFSCESSSRVSLLQNVSPVGAFGASSLAAHLDFASGNNAQGIAVGDLDGDGKPDFVFGNQNDSTLMVYRNQQVGATPAITSQPADQTVYVGQSGYFAVAASGAAPLSIQWFENSAPVAGWTNSSINLPNRLLAQNGSTYFAVAANGFGSVTSRVATLTVRPVTIPVITTQPNSIYVGLGGTVSLSVDATGAYLAYQWYFTHGPVGGQTNASLSLASFAAKLAGEYYVVVSNEAGAVTSQVATVTLLLPGTRYVSPNSAAPSAPFESWDTAAHTIQEAIDLALPGDTVLVGDGVYNSGGKIMYGSLLNRVAIDKGIMVASVNGPATTWIVGSGVGATNGNGSGAVRCAYIGTNAVLSGFTLTNGHTLTSGNSVYELSGGGVWCPTNGNAVVTNCVLVNNSAYTRAGGAYYGSLNNCILKSNLVFGASTVYGGGMAYSTLNNCTLVGNKANGPYVYGGGSFYGTLNNSVLCANSATGSAYSYGGGSCYGVLKNCTLVRNTSSYYGGGARYGTLTNCIVYSNTASSGPNYSGSMLYYSCTTPLTNNVGNISNAPLFVNLTNGDLHLQAGSPGIDAGNDAIVAADWKDLDGSARISGAHVDMGAFEYSFVPMAPSIAAQPQNQTVYVGSNAMFSVTAGGTAPFAYQWLFNGSAIANATNATLGLTNVQSDQAGVYSVAITNALGGIVSAGATLTVNPAPLAIFDIAADLSTTTNPKGPWSYGWASTVGGTITLLDKPLQAYTENSVACWTWGSTIDNYLDVVKNTSATTATTDSGAGNYPPGTVWFMAGADGTTHNYCVIRFTVPAGGDGTYLLQTAVKAALDRSPGQDADFHVARSGTEIFGQFLAKFAGTGYTNTLSLVAGDTVDFIVGRGADGARPYSALKIQGSLSQITSAPLAPLIVSQPQDKVIYEGSTAKFAVTARGSAPLAYQWLFNGDALAGETNATLTLSSAKLADTGTYSVTITNVAGTATSSNATLTVNRLPDPAAVPAGLVSWWPGEGNANDLMGQNNGQPQGGVGYFVAKVGQGFLQVQSEQFVSVPASGSLNVGAGDGLSVELWLNVPVANTVIPLVEWNNGVTWGAHFFIFNTKLYANLLDMNGSWHVIESAAGVVQTNVYQHVALTYDKATGQAALYCNGTAVQTATLGSFASQTTYDFYLGRRPANGPVTFVGILDEVSLYNRALTGTEVQAVFQAGPTGKLKNLAPVAPTIVAQPQSQAVYAGASAAFSVTANGTVPLAYQWHFNGNPIANATNATFGLTNVQNAQAGVYSVAITNSAGGLVSAGATLTVNPAPLAIYDIAADFSTNTNPKGPWSYGWASTVGGPITLLNSLVQSAGDNGVAVWAWGSTQDSYLGLFKNSSASTMTTDGGAGNFPPGTVAFMAGADGTTHNFAVIRFTVPAGGDGNYLLQSLVKPYLDRSPGQDADYHVARNGTEIFKQFLPAFAGTGFTNTLSLAAGDTVDFIVGRGQDGVRAYSALKIQGTLKFVTSDPQPPTLASQPQNQAVFVGSNATFSVAVNGAAPLYYQWLRNGEPLAGATNSTLALTAVTLADAGNYSVAVTNSLGSIVSSSATLTVSQPPVASYDIAADFSISTNPKGPWSYGWASTVGGPITLLNSLVQSAGDNGVAVWAWGSTQDPYLGLFKNCSASTMTTDGGAGNFPPGTVAFMAGADGTTHNFAVIRFTVPAGGDGTYLLQSLVKPYLDRSPGQDADYHVARNGTEIFSQFLPAFAGTGFTNTLSLAAGDTVDFIVGRGADGVRAYSALKIQGNLQQINSVPLPPAITAQPQNQTVPSGATANFSVTASGSGSLSYQWFANGAPLAYGTNRLLQVADCQALQSGNAYQVVVANSQGSVTSQVATLTVLNPPMIASLTPAFGPVGTVVTIQGANFDPAPANNQVYFGAVKATVTSASSTALSVTVPAGATFQPVTVTAGGLTAASSQSFLVTFPGGSAIDASVFGARFTTNTAASPNQFVIADLDGDGKPDLAVACGNANVISVFRNQSASGAIEAASFGPRVDFATDSGPSYLAVADLNGDGKLDLVTANYNANTVSVLRNTSSPGSLTADSFAAKVDFAAGSNPRAVAVADVDSDGKPDILVANYGEGTVSVLRNACAAGAIQAGSFAVTAKLAVGSGPADIGVGDLNGDGKPDLVVANFGGTTVSVLRNTGDLGVGSFASKVDLTCCSAPISVAVADLDGDGKADIVVGGYTSTTLSVLRNIGSGASLTAGSFASRVDFAAGGRIKTIAVGDLNGDGKLDVAAVTEMSSHLALFQNVAAPGAFSASSLAARVDYVSGNNAHGVALGDLNGDGRADIVFANQYDNTFSVYRNLQVASAPLITGQPANQTANVGGDVAFSVTATGSAPLVYQWFCEGTMIANATNATLALSNVQSNQAGSYSVMITNAVGMAVSAGATLTVNPAALAVYDLAADLSTTTNPKGPWSYGWASTVGGAITLLNKPVLGYTENNVACWTWGSTSDDYLGVVKNTSATTATTDGGAGNFPPGTVSFMAGADNTAHNYCVIRFTVPAGADGSYLLQTLVKPYLDRAPGQDADFHVARNGTEIFGKFLAAFTGTGYTNTLELTAGETVDFMVGRGADGQRAYSALKIQGTLSQVTSVPRAPFISGQPQNQAVYLGSNATFSVMASGSAPLFYQWLFNNSPLPGETNATLALVNVQNAQAGVYSVAITNSLGGVVSSGATLTVSQPPLAVYDLAADLSLTTNPKGPWSYGWASTVGGAITLLNKPVLGYTENGVACWTWGSTSDDYLGVVKNTSATTATTDGGAGNFPPGTVSFMAGADNTTHNYCVIRFTVPTGADGNYLLQTLVKPYLDRSPGQDADFHVARNGTEIFGQFLPAFTGTAYTNVLNLTAGDTVDFMVGRGADGQRAYSALKIQGTLNQVTSAPQPPSITTQPQSQTGYVGASATFNVSAGGAVPLVYQWFENNALLPEGTNAKLTIANCQLAQNSNTYYAIVTNAYGSATSQVATLSVVAPPVPTITAQPVSVISWAGGKAAFSVAATSSSPLRYQWFFQNNALTGATNATLSLTNLAAGQAGVYFVRVINSVGPVDSDPATLTLQSLAYALFDSFDPALDTNQWAAVKGTTDAYSGVAPISGTNALWFGGSTNCYAVTRPLDVRGGGRIGFYLQYININVPGQPPKLPGAGIALQYSTNAGISWVRIADYFSVPQNRWVYLQADIPTNACVAGVQFRWRQNTTTGLYYDYWVMDDVSVNCLEVAPRILTQPASQNAFAGYPASLSLSCTGAPPLVCQWYYGGSPINGATATTLAFSQVTEAMAGDYFAVITNRYGSVTSSVANLTVQGTPALLSMTNVNVVAGQNLVVPINLLSRSNVNYASFTLAFDPARLTYQGMTLGDGAATAMPFVNAGSKNSGLVGFAFGMEGGKVFAPGSQQLALVSFAVNVVTQATPTLINFIHAPGVSSLELLDPAGVPVVMLTSNAAVSVASCEVEGDLTGDGLVSGVDFVKLGRIVAGLDTLNPADFQRADCAPRESSGDGIISVADWVQAGRYANNLDAAQVAGGPLSAVGQSITAQSRRTLSPGAQSPNTTRLYLGDTLLQAGQTNTVRVMLNALGGESALAFTLNFDAAHLQLLTVARGGGAAGASFTPNLLQAAAGQVGLAMLLPGGASFAAGEVEVVQLTFVVASNAPASAAFSFGQTPVYNEIVDSAAHRLSANFIDASLPVNHAPTTLPLSLVAVRNTPVAVDQAKFLLNSADADGDTVSLVNLLPTTVQNGTICQTNGAINYVPPANFTGNDSFGFTLSDGRGGLLPVSVSVSVVDKPAVPRNQMSLAARPNGARYLKFAGVLGLSYEIQRSTDLKNWTPVTTLTPGRNGLMDYEDGEVLTGACYYRTRIISP